MQFDNINNYYESLVFDEINLLAERMQELDENTLEDIVCIALNKLPARYIRYAVDTAFFLSSTERDEININVKKAVNDAILFVTQNPRSATDASAVEETKNSLT